MTRVFSAPLRVVLSFFSFIQFLLPLWWGTDLKGCIIHMLPVSVASLMPLVLICLSKRNTSHGHTKTVGAHAQIRIIKTTFSNLIFCLSVIRCFLTATEKCILLIFISFVLLCVCVEVRVHIPSGAHPITARSCFTEIRTEETLEPDVIICLWGEQAAVSVGAFVLRGERLDHEETQKGKRERGGGGFDASNFNICHLFSAFQVSCWMCWDSSHLHFWTF